MSARRTGTIRIVNRLGLHARPAMAMADLANTFASAVRLRNGEQVVDAKSIMEILMLAAVKGTELQLECEGPDAEGCYDALARLVANGFDED
ncbi:MAG: HPr family phosphocarrier protein [Phycisphaeraceae bacterium]|nr:HPr family phosphocarrier protein [Phycisphaeraceae bacterium]MCW5755467.1 HPr family phosphocarrier protein [Phycisphaeraceae bacterium]